RARHGSLRPFPTRRSSDLDGGAAQLAGPHGRHGALLGGAGGHHRPPPAAVDRHHPGGDRVLVLGPVLGAGARSAAGGPHPHVGLVPVADRPPHRCSPSGPWACSIDNHIPTKSGSVLAVVPMLTTFISGTLSPMIAAAVAIR